MNKKLNKNDPQVLQNKANSAVWGLFFKYIFALHVGVGVSKSPKIQLQTVVWVWGVLGVGVDEAALKKSLAASDFSNLKSLAILTLRISPLVSQGPPDGGVSRSGDFPDWSFSSSLKCRSLKSLNHQHSTESQKFLTLPQTSPAKGVWQKSDEKSDGGVRKSSFGKCTENGF